MGNITTRAWMQKIIDAEIAAMGEFDVIEIGLYTNNVSPSETSVIGNFDVAAEAIRPLDPGDFISVFSDAGVWMYISERVDFDFSSMDPFPFTFYGVVVYGYMTLTPLVKTLLQAEKFEAPKVVSNNTESIIGVERFTMPLSSLGWKDVEL